MSELARDGVRLWYTEAGSGAPPLLFAHGWCCDHTYFAPQFEHFAKVHRVVSVDLRGHGKSDKPEQDYTIGGFADDVVWMSEQLGLEDVVVVGHSMGAGAALEAAARRPDAVIAAVLVDPIPVVRPPGIEEIVDPFVEQLRGMDYKRAAEEFIGAMLFVPTDNPDVKATIVEAMCAAPQHVMASAMEQNFKWDGEAAARACSVPVLTIASATPVGDIAKFRELTPQLVTGQTVGAGHFNQLLVPEQVNSMIECFLATTRLVRPSTDRALLH